MDVRLIAVACLTMAVPGIATAQGPFLSASDMRLREDISLLADSHAVVLPVDEWPLAREDVAQALAGISADDLQDAALRAALARVKARTATTENAAQWQVRQASLTAGQPALLREFDTLGRENGELTVAGGMSTDRYAVTLSVTGAADPVDGQHVRLDGSDVSLRMGNWLLSLNQIDRWWGPGIAGSLILSSNARPMPAVSLDRVRSLPFDVPVLRWLGPWRFSWFFGLGERHRADFDQPLFMGMRLSFKPSSMLEIGLSRSAQFCGRNRECNIGTFSRMLIGQDNLGLRGLSTNPAKEPGNQMSGYDLRLVSPWKALPAALYAQAIGEDNSNLSLPLRFLVQVGAQTWWALADGSVLRAYIEHADTATDLFELWNPQDRNPAARTDTAYRNHIFFAGYRYRGRTIGHTTDSDSLTTAVGLSLTDRGGGRWGVDWIGGRLDRKGVPDIYNPITFGPSHYHSLQVSWNGTLGGQQFGLQIGHEQQSPSSAGSGNGMFGFVQWRKMLD